MSRNYLVCEGCVQPLDVSDRYYPSIDCVLCIRCAPTFMDLLSEPTSFVERDDDEMPLSREKREAMLDAHIAAGGHPHGNKGSGMTVRSHITPALRQRANDFLHWRQANGGAVRWDRGGVAVKTPLAEKAR